MNNTVKKMLIGAVITAVIESDKAKDILKKVISTLEDTAEAVRDNEYIKIDEEGVVFTDEGKEVINALSHNYKAIKQSIEA